MSMTPSQHSLPFRKGLYDKCGPTHRARFMEGKYGAWWGWPNLTNKVCKDLRVNGLSI